MEEEDEDEILFYYARSDDQIGRDPRSRVRAEDRTMSYSPEARLVKAG